MTVRKWMIFVAGLLACFAMGMAPIGASEGDAASEDAEELPWVSANDGESFTFTGGMRIQPRYEYDDSKPSNSSNNFRINRLRIKGKGEIMGLAKYYAEVKFDAKSLGNSKFGTFTAPSTPQAENAWIEFNTLPYTNLRVGLYDIPFSRNALTSDSKLLFMDRSLIKMLLDDVGFADNTIGALFHKGVMDGRFSYAGGVFQNDKVSNGLPTIAGRFTLQLLDPAKPDAYGAYWGSYIGEGRRLDIGTNFAYTPDADTGPTPTACTTSGCGTGAGNLYAVGGDLFFNTGPFTLQGEYDWYRRNTPSGEVDTKGGYIQAGALLNSLIERVSTASWIPPTELAVRYQDVTSGDVFSPGRTQAADVGMNFYIRDHKLKVQTTYTYFDRETSGTSNRYQLQLQLDF